MKQTIYIILYVVLAAFMIGCTGSGGTKHELQASDTLYTWRAAMQVYGYQPERALQIIDSAVIVGNMSEVWADANRARVYSMTQMNEQVDSLLGGSKGAGLEKGKAICEQLLKHDSLKTNLKFKQEVLDILVYTERQLQDTVMWLQRSRELVDVYHQMGPEKEIDALRTEAEIGAALYFAGQQQESLAKLDSVINLLNEKPSFKFNELDALILASKRKILVLIAQEKTIKMTQKQWTLKRTLTASQLPADFSLKVVFEQKDDVTPEDDKDYEFGCVSRIPFKVYNSKGEKICDHTGAVTVTDGHHPVMKGSQISGWWLTYALGINPDKLLNFDKKTLTVKSDRAEFNDMDYKYPYISD